MQPVSNAPVPADGATGAQSGKQPLVLGTTPAGSFRGVDELLEFPGAPATMGGACSSHHDPGWALDHEMYRTTLFLPAQHPAYAVFCVSLLNG